MIATCVKSQAGTIPDGCMYSARPVHRDGDGNGGGTVVVIIALCHDRAGDRNGVDTSTMPEEEPLTIHAP